MSCFKYTILTLCSIFITQVGYGNTELIYKALQRDLNGVKLVLNPENVNTGSSEAIITNGDLPKALKTRLQFDTNVTPLMIAAALGEKEMVQTLLANGAKKWVITKKYNSHALDLACKANELEIAQIILGKKDEADHFHLHIGLSDQTIILYQDDKEVLRSAISTGKKGYATPKGEYIITGKDKLRRSSIYHVNMPFFMRLNDSAIGIHQGYVPNYPASHGCIRVKSGKAKQLFNMAPIGTTVTIE